MAFPVTLMNGNIESTDVSKGLRLREEGRRADIWG